MAALSPAEQSQTARAELVKKRDLRDEIVARPGFDWQKLIYSLTDLRRSQARGSYAGDC